MMNPIKIDNQLSKIPFEIRNAVKPLNNDKAFAILIALLDKDEMRFGDIKNEFDTDTSGEIGFYLNKLADAGLVEKTSKIFKDIGNIEKTYYHPTNLSKSLIGSLLDGMMIKKTPTPFYPITNEGPRGTDGIKINKSMPELVGEGIPVTGMYH